jgi:hypothetical protein
LNEKIYFRKVNMSSLSNLSGIKSSLKYCENILGGSKHKSEGIRLLMKRVQSITERLEKGEEIVRPMIELLAGLDRAYEMEWKYGESIGKAIAAALSVMKKMGAKPLRAEKGDRFDPRIHCAVGKKDVALPHGTILEVVYRGFKLDGKPYYAEVIVAYNPESKPGIGDVACEARENKEVGAQEKQRTCEKRQEKAKLDWPFHTLYQARVRARLIPLLNKDKEVAAWLEKNKVAVWSVFNLDLDPIRGKIVSLYSKDKRGHPPCDPFAIIRSLLLMLFLKETSITAWASEVKLTPVLSILSGFKRNEEPAVGTYYEFFKRLENGPYERKCQHRVLDSDRRHARIPYRMPQEKPQEKPKREPAEEGVLQALVAELKSHEGEPLPNDLEKRLNEILAEVAVKPSADKGLLGDTQNLVAAGDGSVVPSSADSHGKPTCDCRKLGIYRCAHLRKFSDMDAWWGWDNEVKDFVFGYRYYQLVCGVKKHDLPVYLSMASANTHEAVMLLKLLARFEKECYNLMPSVRFRKGAFDAIHDAYAVYLYLTDKKIEYAIPYSKEPSHCVALGNEGLMANAKGTPLCPAGLPMRYHTKDKHGGHVYACPVKRPTRKGGKYIYRCHRHECPREALCEPNSLLGPLIRVPSTLNPRIHPAIPRQSQQYKTLLASRTTCERSNSAKKHTFLMKITRTRVMPYSFIRLTLISIIEHVRAWFAELEAKQGENSPGILTFLGLQPNAI